MPMTQGCFCKISLFLKHFGIKLTMRVGYTVSVHPCVDALDYKLQSTFQDFDEMCC
jgi:hypothetical protein